MEKQTQVCNMIAFSLSSTSSSDDFTSNLCCSDSSKMLMGVCRVLQKQCIFEESDIGAALKAKSPRNLVANWLFQ